MTTRPAPSGPPAARPDASGWLRAAAAVLACTLLSELLASRVDLADIIMVYLAGVAFTALRERLAVSIATVCASIFVFDLVFVPPRWGLNPINKSHFLTFGIMLAVGLLVSRLADQVRTQRVLAEERARRAGVIARLAEGLAAAATPAEVADCVATAVRDTFSRPGRLVLDGEQEPAGAARWPVEGPGGRLATLAVDLEHGAIGPEDASLLAAFAHQAAVALGRCAFERKSLDAQLEAEAERLRNTLLSGISHDFRTPLTTIVGAATSLLQQDQRIDEPRRAGLVRSIRDEAARLHALVSDLLDLTRLEEGAVQLQCEWCPADDLLQEAMDALGGRLHDHPVTLRADPEAIVWCDPRLVEQALVNMVDNAVRHTPAGTRIRVAIEVDGHAWRLQVADDGPGLPPGAEQDVFRKFHRGRPEPSGGGTGLGLAICAAVARVHGGSIEALNRQGACFTMTLPQPDAPRDLETE
jgi:two-component system sensor histidine kinase KdpD